MRKSIETLDPFVLINHKVRTVTLIVNRPLSEELGEDAIVHLQTQSRRMVQNEVQTARPLDGRGGIEGRQVDVAEICSVTIESVPEDLPIACSEALRYVMAIAAIRTDLASAKGSRSEDGAFNKT
jgi:hypothetical protein